MRAWIEQHQNLLVFVAVGAVITEAAFELITDKIKEQKGNQNESDIA